MHGGASNLQVARPHKDQRLPNQNDDQLGAVLSHCQVVLAAAALSHHADDSH
jgi:hypothetical protein